MGVVSRGFLLGAPPLAPVPAASPSFAAPSPPPLVSLRAADPFKLPVIKDAKAYLDLHDIIQYYLHLPEYSTKRSDDALITDAYNLEASRFWEGQLRVAVRDGSLRFLFDNKGAVFHGKGFEMLAALDQHCCPDTVSNVFTTLMSLFNNVQGDSEQILAFRSRFNGLIMDMARSKIILPPILLVMLFLHALHSCY
jgi:hypothetical protein